MKSILNIALFLCVLPTLACAQFPSRFYIGAFWVGGDQSEPWCPNPGEVQYYTPYRDTNYVQRTLTGLTPHHLSQYHLERARELGLNLVAIHVDDIDSITASPDEDRQVVRNINRSMIAGDAPAMDLCLFSWRLDDFGKLDRLMFHPESVYDFRTRSGNDPDDYENKRFPSFDDYPIAELELSKTIEDNSQTNNCVLVKGVCEFSGLEFQRKRELSAFDSRILNNAINNASGMYHVSVILSADPLLWNLPQNNATEVLRIRVEGAFVADIGDPDHSTTFVEFPILGSDFYEQGQLRSGPFELHLGHVGLNLSEYAGGTEEVVTLEPVTQLGARWTTLSSTMTTRLAYADLTEHNLLGEFDIRVMALTTHQFYIDAVCMSTAHAYNLFGNRQDLPTAYVNLDHPLRIRKSIDLMTRDVDGSRLEHVALLTMPEQDPYAGYWRSTKYLSRLMRNATDASDGSSQCMGYSAKGAEISTNDLHGLAEFHKNIASGYYAYVYDREYPRWNQDVSENEYNEYTLAGDIINGNDRCRRRLWKNIMYYRRYARTRQDYDVSTPWIPFIQNHTSNFISGWDSDTLREPNAAELRLLCNIALEHGAHGLMFYQYNTHGTNPWTANPSFGEIGLFPRNWLLYTQDSSGQHPQPFGSVGFIQSYNFPRTLDMHGENKWDSTRNLIATFLQPMGDLMRTLTWKKSRSWYNYPRMEVGEQGQSDFVTTVHTWRGDTIDCRDRTLIETADFRDNGNHPYVFVVNVNAHKFGHRNVRIQLAPEGYMTQWKVTDLRNGEIHIVKPTISTDTAFDNLGLSLYLAAGEATLLKLEKMEGYTSTFESCIGSNIYIWKDAELHTEASQQLYFGEHAGIISEGIFETALGTRLEPCSETWLGVITRGRNDLSFGQAFLHGTYIRSGGVRIGPFSKATMDEGCEMYQCDPNILNCSGEFSSNFTTSTYHDEHLMNVDGTSTLMADSIDYTPINNYVIQSTGGAVTMKHVRILNSGSRGIWARGYAYLTSAPNAGRNKIVTENYTATAEEGSVIMLGYPVWIGDNWVTHGRENMFSIGLSRCLPYALHMRTDSSSWILAAENFWVSGAGDCPSVPDYKVAGRVFTLSPLSPPNPVPFAGGSGGSYSKSALHKSATQSPPGTHHAAEILALLANRDTTAARSRVAQLVSTGALANAPLHELNALTFCGPVVTRELLQHITASLDNRSDLESKVSLVGLLKRERDFKSALRVLDAFSFATRPSLRLQALRYRAEIYAMDADYGFDKTPAVLDSMRALLWCDSTYRHFIEYFPYLYSNLRASGASTPKASNAHFLQELPTDFDVLRNFPNPFNNLTTFIFTAPGEGTLKLVVHDALGRVVYDGQHVVRQGGMQSIDIPTYSWAQGIYYYRVEMGSRIRTGKMILAR
ncbi:MAG TPA: T9SS type A sorting domain-containing protein [Bacteroidota bacterium]|nr:T9SS type A sorting domain-containing protein [Bacteroidota bacterium]